MKYQFNFRKQFADTNGGVLASIEFEITHVDGDAGKVTFTYEAGEHWRTACECGILIFADYFNRFPKVSINIRILRVDWLPVDTSTLGVMFATVEGLKQFFDMKIEGMGFDPVNALFTLPERRRAFSEVSF